MIIKLHKQERSVTISLEDLQGDVIEYYNKSHDWLNRRIFFGLLKRESRKLIDSEYPNKLIFVFQNPVEGDWYETGSSSISFYRNGVNTKIEFIFHAAGKRFLGKVDWGEYLNIIRIVEEYLGVIRVDITEDVLHTLYPSEMTRELMPHLQKNLLQDALLMLFIALFFLFFQIYNWGTALFSLMGVLLVLVFSYRDFNLYRQISRS